MIRRRPAGDDGESNGWTAASPAARPNGNGNRRQERDSAGRVPGAVKTSDRTTGGRARRAPVRTCTAGGTFVASLFYERCRPGFDERRSAPPRPTPPSGARPTPPGVGSTEDQATFSETWEELTQTEFNGEAVTASLFTETARSKTFWGTYLPYEVDSRTLYFETKFTLQVSPEDEEVSDECRNHGGDGNTHDRVGDGGNADCDDGTHTDRPGDAHGNRRVVLRLQRLAFGRPRDAGRSDCSEDASHGWLNRSLGGGDIKNTVSTMPGPPSRRR